jgi:iron complex outermembrane receptor protein
LIRYFEDNFRVYGSVRRFYRYPATDEIITVYFTPVPVINFGLKPEWGHELELGGDWALGSLVLGGRIYHQWMRDEVFLDYGTFQSFNLGKTSRTGVDLDASYRLTETMDVSLKYTWINAELDSGLNAGSDVPLVPEHKFRMMFNYHPIEPLHVSLGASYTESVYIGGDYSNTKDTLQDYVLVDLNVRYAISPELELFATVDNLFDKEYTSFGFSGFFNDGFYPGVGRSAKIGLLWKF